MASSIFSMFRSVFVLLLASLISLVFHRFIGLKSGNMVMAIEDVDSMALLPFGSASRIGSFFRLPQCGGPRRTGLKSSNMRWRWRWRLKMRITRLFYRLDLRRISSAASFLMSCLSPYC
ncbi:uncharacterized protein LOC111485526 isoform X2 [Cucurbita maxima]|uniref:Uncharacterized protein LOC111485526 isoform X2 n=1 Tax=Cucurbita maxima TaxID=3661 RepID=A0A6J1JKZ2_CUCMA|nr:uncharacterized protein LOC111485526 isoform X2 [Cucurbita maxima]